MPVPTPPADASGGYMIINYTNGVRTHKWRFHVDVFAAGTGVYTTVIGGAEANVAATYAGVTAALQRIYTNAWSFTLGALYQIQTGLPVQIAPVGSFPTVTGTNAGAVSAFAEAFTCLNLKSTANGRMKFFLIEPTGWSYAAANVVVANAGGNIYEKLVAYLVTQPGVRITAHDGKFLQGTAHGTQGVNKKLRRRAGNA